MTESTAALPASAPSTSGVPRRTVLKGAAWAAPVVIAAVAVPAAAASNGSADTLAAGDLAKITITSFKKNVVIANKHGFTITNKCAKTVTVLVSFTATAFGISDSNARSNVTSVTSTDSAADYGVERKGGATATPNSDTYKGLWGSAITVASAGFLKSKATRSGQATFVLPPNSSFTFWQTNINLSGDASVVATIVSAAPLGAPKLEPVSGGGTAKITF